MDGLTQRVLDKLLEWGADLAGVAPVERFENAPEGHKPTDFMPECKSVISIALLAYAAHDNIRCAYGVHGMIKGSGGRSDIQIADGPGQAAAFIQEHLAQDNMHLYDKVMLENCFGIICGDFCGKCLHKCPSKKLCAKDLEDYDFSSRHSSLNRSWL